jgi:hypothetical protein
LHQFFLNHPTVLFNKACSLQQSLTIALIVEVSSVPLCQGVSYIGYLCSRALIGLSSTPTAASKEMVALCQTLIEVGWPQSRTPIQMDNSTAIGVTNLAIVP